MAKSVYGNIALCYHGIVANESEKMEYRTYTEDFKAQIDHLSSLGYTFVTPFRYYQVRQKLVKVGTPVATIIFDDALGSLNLIAGWLIGKAIPFGIAVIGRRLQKHLPEEGFLSWAEVKQLVDSGYCQLLSHTYNMHHFCLESEEGKVISGPIMEAPCYIDHGEFVYINPGDARWYWDGSFIDGDTWAFPVLGTDMAVTKPVISTIKFKASSNIAVDRMRLWTCLHDPNSAGYDAKITININGTMVANCTVNPVRYETRSQWPEREFVTVMFDRSYSIEAGKSYNLQITTLNTGNAVFRIYAIPDFSGDFQLTTTCSGESFTSDEAWPARACIILADNSGRTATETEFAEYIRNDLSNNSSVVNRYLNGSWAFHSTGYNEANPLSVVVLGGTYSDGSLADTSIRIKPEKGFTCEVLRFKYASNLGMRYPLLIDVFINEQKVGTFGPNWWDWHWQEVNIDPFAFEADKDYYIRFKTFNSSSGGPGIARICMDQPAPPQPLWDKNKKRWIVPDNSAYTAPSWYQVARPEGTDVYPDGVTLQGGNWQWKYLTPYDGPGKALLDALSCSTGQPLTVNQICYPFGSYYSCMVGDKEDVCPSLKTVLNNVGINSGYSVWDDQINGAVESTYKASEYVIPRLSLSGLFPITTALNTIDKYIGKTK